MDILLTKVLAMFPIDHNPTDHHLMADLVTEDDHLTDSAADQEDTEERKANEETWGSAGSTHKNKQ